MANKIRHCLNFHVKTFMTVLSNRLNEYLGFKEIKYRAGI